MLGGHRNDGSHHEERPVQVIQYHTVNVVLGYKNCSVGGLEREATSLPRYPESQPRAGKP